MKKQYATPELMIETFDVEDVITASGLGRTILNAFETGWDNVVGFFSSIGSNA